MTRWCEAVLDWWLRCPVGVRSLAPIAVMAFLWWSSSRRPDVQEASAFSAVLHNGAHVVAYATLAGSFLLVLARIDRPASRQRTIVVSFLLAVAYGFVDELHQSFVPGRVCSIADVMTDAAGSVLALMVLGTRLGAAPVSWRSLAIAVVVCLLCVAFATWGPL